MPKPESTGKPSAKGKKFSLLHGEVSSVSEDSLVLDGRVLGKGGPKANPTESRTVMVSDSTRIEVDGSDAALSDIQSGMFGVAKLSADGSAILLSFDSPEVVEEEAGGTPEPVDPADPGSITV